MHASDAGVRAILALVLNVVVGYLAIPRFGIVGGALAATLAPHIEPKIPFTAINALRIPPGKTAIHFSAASKRERTMPVVANIAPINTKRGIAVSTNELRYSKAV